MTGAAGTNGWSVTTIWKQASIDTIQDKVTATTWSVRDPGGNLVAVLALHPDANATDALVAAQGLEHLSGWDWDGDPWDAQDPKPLQPKEEE